MAQEGAAPQQQARHLRIGRDRSRAHVDEGDLAAALPPRFGEGLQLTASRDVCSERTGSIAYNPTQGANTPLSRTGTPSTLRLASLTQKSRWKSTEFLPPTVALEPKPKWTAPAQPSSVSMSPRSTALGFMPMPHSASTLAFSGR